MQNHGVTRILKITFGILIKFQMLFSGENEFGYFLHNYVLYFTIGKLARLRYIQDVCN